MDRLKRHVLVNSNWNEQQKRCEYEEGKKEDSVLQTWQGW